MCLDARLTSPTPEYTPKYMDFRGPALGETLEMDQNGGISEVPGQVRGPNWDSVDLPWIGTACESIHPWAPPDHQYDIPGLQKVSREVRKGVKIGQNHHFRGSKMGHFRGPDP